MYSRDGQIHGAVITMPRNDERLPVSNRPGSGGLRRNNRPKKSRVRVQSLPRREGFPFVPGEGASPLSKGRAFFRALDQDDVVLFLRVDRLDLQ